MPPAVAPHLRDRAQKWLGGLRESLMAGVEHPARALILQTAYQNRGWFLLVFGINLLTPVFEGGTFAIILLALQLLSRNQPPDFQAWPLPTPLVEWLQPLTTGELFMGLVLSAILLQGLRSSLTYLGAIASTYLATNIEAAVQRRVYRQILSFSFACASQYKVGDLLEYVTTPSAYVRFLLLYGNHLVVCGLSAIAYLLVLFLISIPLTLTAILLFGPLIGFQKTLIRRIRQASVGLTEAGVDLSERTVESLQALRLIHSLDRQAWAINNVEQALNGMVQFTRRQNLLTAAIDPISEIVAIAAVGIFAISGYLLLSRQGPWFLPQLLVFITACNRLAGQLRIANNLLGNLAQCWGPIARLDEILSPENKQFRRREGQTFTRLKREIRFEQVGLSYGPGSPPALSQISFAIPKNTVTALVGASGAGKSSIVDLLLGLYEPSAGEIYIDGINLQHLNLETWRQSLGVVSQDSFLFNASVTDNLRFGLLDATLEEIVAAAKIAQAHEFILQLPQGYDTLLGERGFRLSGGQRQRLALARMILRQPEVLILDEATSALDSHSEQLVQQALALFQNNRTVLAIAHRLSTIIHADQILVLNQGQLVEQGTHQTLLQQKGYYANLWSLQSQGKSADPSSFAPPHP